MVKARSPIVILGKRFLLSKSSDGFLSFIAWVSVIGVALGVLALTVVTSVINGFEGELTRVITGVNGHVLLYTRGEPIHQPELIESKIRETLPTLEAVTTSFITELMIAGRSGVSGAVLQGVDPKSIGEVTILPRRITQGRMPTQEKEIAMGSALAEKLGIQVGDQIRLIVPFTQDLASQPKALEGQLVGVFKVGMYDYDSKFALMTLSGVQKFLDQPGAVTNFSIKLKKHSDSQFAADRLQEVFSYPFKAKDWSQLNRNLFYAIKLEKVVIAIILTAIVIVAAFNVVSTLMMMIHDKTKEIAILKAMGFRPLQSFRLFCMIGVGIGAVGTLIGVISGLVLGWGIEATHWIRLPEDVYPIGFLPVVVRWREILLVAVLAMLIAFLASLYPSWKVSRRSPLEGLRYE